MATDLNRNVRDNKTLRSAESYFRDFQNGNVEMNHRDSFVKVINEARLEIINLCAERVTYKQSRGGSAIIDKQSILNLKNEIK